MPKVKELSVYVNNAYKSSHCFHYEVELLTFFQWNLNLPTVSHFVHTLLPFSLTSDDVYCGQRNYSFKEVKEGLEEFLFYFLDISLQVSTIRLRL